MTLRKFRLAFPLFPLLLGVILTAEAGELHDAVNARDATLVKQLLEKGAAVNERDAYGTPLHMAVAVGSPEIAQALIDAGADLNAKAGPEQMDFTPLHSAAFFNEAGVGGLLVSKGAEVDALSTEGRTPLHVAATKGSAETAKLLLEAGAKPDRGDGVYGDTPFHHAAMAGHIGILELLLAKGTDVNVRSGHSGATALHYVALDKRTPVVEFLLSKGADPSIKDKSGKTAIELAPDAKLKELLSKSSP